MTYAAMLLSNAGSRYSGRAPSPKDEALSARWRAEVAVRDVLGDSVALGRRTVLFEKKL